MKGVGAVHLPASFSLLKLFLILSPPAARSTHIGQLCLQEFTSGSTWLSHLGQKSTSEGSILCTRHGEVPMSRATRRKRKEKKERQDNAITTNFK
jgi:hypothetical protein